MPGTEPIEWIGHFRVLPQDQEFACWREESGDCGVESERAVDAGTVEHTDRARLLPQRSLPAVLGLPAAQAGRPPLGEMDALSHAFPAGTVQEIRGHAARASRWKFWVGPTTVSPTVPSKA